MFAPPYGRPLRFPYGHEKSSPKGELFFMVTRQPDSTQCTVSAFPISASKLQNLPRAKKHVAGMFFALPYGKAALFDSRTGMKKSSPKGELFFMVTRTGIEPMLPP